MALRGSIEKADELWFLAVMRYAHMWPAPFYTMIE